MLKRTKYKYFENRRTTKQKDLTRTTEQTKEPYEVLSNTTTKKRSWLEEGLTKSPRKAVRKNGRPRKFSTQKNHYLEELCGEALKSAEKKKGAL